MFVVQDQRHSARTELTDRHSLLRLRTGKRESWTGHSEMRRRLGPRDQGNPAAGCLGAVTGFHGRLAVSLLWGRGPRFTSLCRECGSNGFVRAARFLRAMPPTQHLPGRRDEVLAATFRVASRGCPGSLPPNTCRDSVSCGGSSGRRWERNHASCISRRVLSGFRAVEQFRKKNITEERPDEPTR
jgi:hypothetical protein